jgi:hypothetical protein
VNIDHHENLSKALMPFLYPMWLSRWGWAELPDEEKEDCRRMASVIELQLEAIRESRMDGD